MRKPKLERKTLLQMVTDAVGTGRYRILPHARQRCSERRVSAPDIESALVKGHPVPRRDRYDRLADDWSYCFEGASVDEETLRVVVAFSDWMLIVTVVRLGGKED